MTGHPLDRPVWSALTSRQAGFAIGDARALRFAPDVAQFAAAADAGPASLAALADLVAPGETIGLVEAHMAAVPEGLRIVKQARCVQMVGTGCTTPTLACDIVPLGAADAPDMLALATLTEPGPFFARTHALGGFIGVRARGRLVAMAGERLRMPGYCEVSAVCTHPDWRGRGLAAALLRRVAERIVARGEMPFLHAYADHAATIALYRRLGFDARATMTYALLTR